MKKRFLVVIVLATLITGVISGCGRKESAEPADASIQTENTNALKATNTPAYLAKVTTPTPTFGNLGIITFNRETTFESNGFRYYVDETKQYAEIIGVANESNLDTELIIPTSLDGYYVTSIGYGAFEGFSNLTSITVHDSVTSIGGVAFGGCSSLTNITIPDSVTSIGEGAFWDCRKLTSITIPDSVTSIEETAFKDCSSLASIKISNSETSIGSDVFLRCNKLKSIKVTPGSFADTWLKDNGYWKLIVY